MARRPPPKAVTRRTRPNSAVLVIRFTRRIARQCALGGSRLPDWVVCDTIANGSRLRTGRRGARGGPVVRFERHYPRGTARNRPAGAKGRTVAVLGELARGGCIALRLLAPAPGGKDPD